jgi:hypothetical protein
MFEWPKKPKVEKAPEEEKELDTILSGDEKQILDRWSHNDKIRKFFDEQRGERDASYDKVLYGSLVAMTGVALAKYGIPDGLNNTSFITDPTSFAIDELSTKLAGAGVAVMGAIHTVQNFIEAYKKGKEIKGFEEGIQTSNA